MYVEENILLASVSLWRREVSHLPDYPLCLSREPSVKSLHITCYTPVLRNLTSHIQLSRRTSRNGPISRSGL